MRKTSILAMISAIIVTAIAVMAVGCAPPPTPPELREPEGDSTGSVIHVLNTGWEDAIVLESDGHYGLVDAGEPGRGEYVVNYLERLVGEGERVRLEFVIGTHSHIDHMGGFDYLLNHDNVTVDKVIIKEESHPSKFYTTTVNTCNTKGIELITTDLEGMELTLGEMKVTLLNGAPLETGRTTNEESICQLVEVGEIKALLAGDMVTAKHERAVYEKIDGYVDLLKVGHHGMSDSNTSTAYVEDISPKVAVYTNGDSWQPMSNDVMLGVQKAKKGYNKLARVGTNQFVTTDIGGLKATFYTDGMKYEAIGEFSKKVTEDEPNLIWEYRPGTELTPIHKILENM